MSQDAFEQKLRELGDSDTYAASHQFFLQSAADRRDDAIDALIRGCASGYGDTIRGRAIGLLGQIKAGKATAVLGDILLRSEESRYLRGCAGSALGNIGSEATAVLSKAIQDKDSKIRIVAIDGLRRMGSEKTVPSLLVGALGDQDHEVARAAMSALASIGTPAASSIVPELSAKDSKVRALSAWALTRIGDSERVKGALIDILESGNDDAKRVAAECLCEMKRPPDECQSGLIACLRHDDERIVYWSAGALGGTGGSAKRRDAAAAALFGVLNHSSANVRMFAATSLGRLGSGTEVIRGKLLSLAQTNRTTDELLVAEAAITALGQIGTEDEVASMKGIAFAKPGLRDAIDDAIQTIKARSAAK
jgi:HEAT repeat protein